MSGPDAQRYGIGRGRERPRYEPRAIQCKNCGGPLSVKDERAELVVCDHCGSHLELSGTEQKVIGGGGGDEFEFPLDLGTGFQYRGVRYEVIARMAFIEDGDPDELTRQYLLYHPSRGTLWLDEYHGQWSLSRTTHVMPEGDPFSLSPGARVRTYDGRKWVLNERGVYELAYVDGALPWVARVGDRVPYAELVDPANKGEQYEVQRLRDELEYGRGRALSTHQVQRATGLSGIEPPPRRSKGPTAAAMRRWAFGLLALSAIVFLFHGILWLYAISSGSEVVSQQFSAQELTGEVLTPSFSVGDSTVIRVQLRAPKLDNAWMYIDAAVVEAGETVRHTFSSDLQYYHGYDGGESWSEGDFDKEYYIEIPRAGTYQLLLKGVSNTGSSSSAQTCLHPAEVTIWKDARPPFMAFFGMIVSLIFAGAIWFGWSKWREEHG